MEPSKKKKESKRQRRPNDDMKKEIVKFVVRSSIDGNAATAKAIEKRQR